MVDPDSPPGMPGTYRMPQRRAATGVLAVLNVAAIVCGIAAVFTEMDALYVAAVLALVAWACPAVAVWRQAVRAYWLTVALTWGIGAVVPRRGAVVAHITTTNPGTIRGRVGTKR